jgi:hypothetical protein
MYLFQGIALPGADFFGPCAANVILIGWIQFVCKVGF